MKDFWEWWQRSGVKWMTVIAAGLLLYYLILWAVETVR